jgi:hypothetical protein
VPPPELDEKAKLDADADDLPLAVALAEELAEELTEPAIASLAASIRASDRQENAQFFPTLIIATLRFQIHSDSNPNKEIFTRPTAH